MNLESIVGLAAGLILLAIMMGTGYGRTVLGTGGRLVRASADGSPRYKTGAATLDWSFVAAVAVDTTVPIDGTIVKAGDKYIEVGTILMRVTASGKFAPWLIGQADGRSVATAAARGDCFILDETVLKSVPGSDYPPCFDGGRVWKSRVVGKAGMPTEAEIEAMFPDITFVND